MNTHRCLQLLFANLSVVQEYLPDQFFRIVRSRADDHPVLQDNLFHNRATSDFERAGLSPCCQKLEQVRHIHCFQSSFNAHDAARARATGMKLAASAIAADLPSSRLPLRRCYFKCFPCGPKRCPTKGSWVRLPEITDRRHLADV